MEVHWTSNLSEFPLRVAFARYALCAQAGRRARADGITQPSAAKSPQARALPKQAVCNAIAPT
nr:hypothetical protein CJ211_06000 [Gardnerella vaginalis]PMC53371.1 hypothetical protein CJ210_06005 [Gardnerella vaginalis]